MPLTVLVAAVLVVVAPTAVAYVVSRQQRPVYGGQVDVIVSTQGYNTQAESLRALSTQKIIAVSERVLGPVAKAADVSLKQLRRAVSVELIGESEVLRITVGDRTPPRALGLAQAVATSYVENLSPPPTRAAYDAQLASLASSIAEIRAKKEMLAGGETPQASDGTPAAPDVERQRLELEELDLRKRLDALRNAHVTVEIQRATPPDVRILSSARLIDKPLSPKPLQAGLTGLLIGLILASGGVFMWWVTAPRFPVERWT